MNRALCVLSLLVLVSAVLGAPPVSGGFMTGSDSGLYVYWFHPTTQVWEMGLESDSGTYDIFPASVPGFYSVAQRASLPRWSLVTGFAEKLYLGDHYPGLPGTPFSPFGFSVYTEGPDSSPAMAPLATGRDSLLPVDAAGDGWVRHAITVPNLSGEPLWFSHDWDPQTPSAPEIKAMRPAGAADYNRLGVGTGETRAWSSLAYAMVFRYRLLTAIPPDSEALDGLAKADVDEPPAGFTVTRYGNAGDDGFEEWCRPTDTLLWRLPEGAGDSIAIRPGCGDAVEDDRLVLTYDPDRTMPITVDVDCRDCDSVSNRCECFLQVVSRASDTLRLSLGLDRARMETSGDRIAVPPRGGVTIPLTITAPGERAGRDVIVCRETSQNLYPYLIFVDYAWLGPSAVDGPADAPRPGMFFAVSPNPIGPGDKAWFRTTVSAGQVDIFNILGQRVNRIPLAPGKNAFWDGRNEEGRPMPAGVYFVRLAGGRETSNAVKIVLVR